MSSDFNVNSTWWLNTTGASTNITFDVNTGAVIFSETRLPIIPNKDWMPYRHFEYQPRWHKKYASYKNQMENMWD